MDAIEAINKELERLHERLRQGRSEEILFEVSKLNNTLVALAIEEQTHEHEKEMMAYR